jgi:hypothetical protein
MLAESCLHQDELEDALSVARPDIATTIVVAPDAADAGLGFERADVTSRALWARDAALVRGRRGQSLLPASVAGLSARRA